MEDVWIKIKADYVCGLGSMRELAEKYDVPINSIKKRSAKEHWSEQKSKTVRELNQKAVQKTVRRVTDKIARNEADRIARLLIVTDQALEKLEQAVQELGKTQKVVKHRHRVSRKLEDEQGKPYFDEVTTEDEDVCMVPAPVDRYGLRQLAATLKDLQAVAAYANGDDDSAKEIRVVIDGDDGGELSR